MDVYLFKLKPKSRGSHITTSTPSNPAFFYPDRGSRNSINANVSASSDFVKAFATHEDAYSYATLLNDDDKFYIHIYRAVLKPGSVNEYLHTTRYKTSFYSNRFANPALNPNYREMDRNTIKKLILVEEMLPENSPSQ